MKKECIEYLLSLDYKQTGIDDDDITFMKTGCICVDVCDDTIILYNANGVFVQIVVDVKKLKKYKRFLTLE